MRQEFPVRGLYTQAALLAHDCIGNTFITVDNNKQLKVFASVDIQSGETIFNNYTATLYVSLVDNYFQKPKNPFIQLSKWIVEVIITIMNLLCRFL